MAAYITTYAVILLGQAYVVRSETCQRNLQTYFYCCGQCTGSLRDKCETSRGSYYTDTFNCDKDIDMSTGAIIGIVLGSVIGLGTIAAAGICHFIRYYRNKPTTAVRCSVFQTGQTLELTNSNTAAQEEDYAEQNMSNNARQSQRTNTELNTANSQTSNFIVNADVAECDFLEPPPSYEESQRAST